MNIDNVLASDHIAIGAVAKKYKSCFWIAGDDVPENESGKARKPKKTLRLNRYRSSRNLILAST